VSWETTEFDGLLEAVPDALVGVDESGVIRFVNRQTESLFGYERDDLVGQPIETLVPESLRPAHEAHREGWNSAPRTRPMGTMLKLSGRRRDGSVFPLECSLCPLNTRDGMVAVAAVREMTRCRSAEADQGRAGLAAGVVDYAGDVTEQRQAARYARSLLEAALDPLVTISPTGKITDVNEATVKVTGLGRHELIGTSFSDYFTEPDKANEGYQLVFDKGSVTDYPLTLRHRDGTLTEVLYNASLYRDGAGNVLGIFAAARDVTEHNRALAKIAHQAKELERLADLERAHSMIESSLDAFVAISPEGMILDANEATVELTGVPRENLIGTSFSDYFTDPKKAEAIYQLVFTEGMAVDYPLTLRHRDGDETLTEVLYNASVYRDTSGEVLGVFATARDVTEQMRAQREVGERLAELEQFQRLTVGRELKMIELKKEIEYLRKFGPADGGEPSHED
jgi:PAS domain S-box-containing protein